jgi:calcineurin-like phosphoesterase family protein
MTCRHCGDGTFHDEGYLADDESLSEEASPATPLRARILWPALGFPAVIAPRERPAESWMLDANATRCVCVLLLSNRQYLSKADAAKYLRIVPWDKRGQRPVANAAGSFKEEELAVRNDAAGGAQQLVIPKASDKHGRLVAFGADREGENGIVVTLANRVTDFYKLERLKDDRLPYLHEIRVSEAASGRLKDDQYHLFWNNESNESAPSDEMALLLRHFARPRREGLGDSWKKDGAFLIEEYEFEYEAIHPPYASRYPGPKRRVDVLHPLFVQRQRPPALQIGHLTDIHVDVRADVYEENLRHANIGAVYKQWTSASFNNWNRNFLNAYADAKQQAHVLLLTGDLIDYGRGHWGTNKRDTLGQDDMYHVDRNWFLFYSLLVSGKRYTRPAYTSLGNHDWRLNPYPPFAVAGAPNPRSYINNSIEFCDDDRKKILQTAHGKGHDLKFAYNSTAKSIGALFFDNMFTFFKQVLRLMGQARTMDERGSPAETTVESVAWYLLSINPFLDYYCTLPSGHQILMLDWAEDEDVLFPIVYRAAEWPYMLWQLDSAADPGPKAKRCLTALQKRVLGDFAAAPGDAKIIGMHAAPVGPYSDWYDSELLIGRKAYENPLRARGPVNYATKKADGTIDHWNGHPFFAVRPKGAGMGVEADYGSFVAEREFFFKQVLADKSHIRLVFSGHIHRAGLFVVNVAKEGGAAVAGHMRVWGITDNLVRGARSPAVSAAPRGAHGPLFVNTTSLGPKGHSHPVKDQYTSVEPGYAIAELAGDGMIRRVEFKPPMLTAVPVPTAAPVRHEIGAFV